MTMIIVFIGIGFFVVVIIAIAYTIGEKVGRRKCKKEFEETFDFEWVDFE